MKKSFVISQLEKYLLEHMHQEKDIMKLAKSLGIEDELRSKTRFYDFNIPGYRQTKKTDWTCFKLKQWKDFNKLNQQESDILNTHSYFVMQHGSDLHYTCHCGYLIKVFPNRIIECFVNYGSLFYNKLEFHLSYSLLKCEFTPEDVIASEIIK